MSRLHETDSYPSILSDEERHQLCVLWNRDEQRPRDLPLLHQQVEAQAARSPDSVAIVSGPDAQFGRVSTQVSYGQLNERSNRLAHCLLRRGIGPESIVALCIDRSADFMVAMLSVLKSGAACLPIDPALPAPRIDFMLGDADPKLTITTGQYRSQVDKQQEVLCLDTQQQLFAGEPVENPNALVSHDHLAFVFYTSGSTGQPKGVALPHGRRFQQRLFELTSSDRHLFKCSVGFSLMLMEVFLPLASGGTLFVMPPGTEADTQQVRDFVSRNEITVAHFVPSMLRVFVQEGLLTSCESLRYLISIGEPLSSDIFQRAESLSAAKLCVVYGATEAPSATAGFAPADCSHDGNWVGFRLPRREIYLLDQRNDLVPIGCPGEVCIGGRLARGYLNRPDLTAEKFIPNPFGKTPGSRLYRTGDIGRYRSDGSLELLGRADRQVQIRGSRVELDEIETMLRRLPDIRDAAVIADPQDQRIDAFVVSPGGQWSAERIRGVGAQALPHCMMPSRVFPVDELPRTASGKTDYAALRSIAASHPATVTGGHRTQASGDASLERRRDYVAPRNPTEEQLASIWSDLLQIRDVGVHDNFFELGGHSLLAARLCGALEKQFTKPFPMATLLRAPTVALLAELVLHRPPTDTSAASAVKTPMETAATPLFVVSPGTVFFLQQLAQRLMPTRPLYALQAPGLDSDQEKMLNRVEDIAALHLREIRRIQPRGPYLISGRCFGGHVALEIAHQLLAEGESIRSLIVFDSGPPDPVSKPLPGMYRTISADRMRRAADHLRSGVLPSLIWRKTLKRWRRVRAKVTDVRVGWFAVPEYRRLYLRERANWDALKYYRAEPYPGSITLIRSTEFNSLAEKQFHLGWKQFALGGFQCREVSGSHLGMFEEPVVKDLAAIIEECIAQQDVRSSPVGDQHG